MTDYINKAVAMRKLVDLPAELDAVAVQRCIEAIHSVPAADVVEIVRCKDCAVPHNRWTGCPRINGTIMRPDDYCSYGERKEA